MTLLEKQAKALEKEGYHYNELYDYYYFEVAYKFNPKLSYGKIVIRKIGSSYSTPLFHSDNNCIMSYKSMDEIRFEMERIDDMLKEIYLNY